VKKGVHGETWFPSCSKGAFFPGTVRNGIAVSPLDGVWDVERTGGFLPPLLGMRKHIQGTRGQTVVGPLRMSFDVRGEELHYHDPFRGFIDLLEVADEGHVRGRATFRGREYGQFEMRRLEMAQAEQLEQQLVKHIDEALAMENNVLRMLDGMIATTDDPEINEMLQRHRAETEEHATRMRERLESHGESPSVVRETGGMLGALMKSVVDLARGEKAGRNARDSYATEAMEIASYQLLERIAQKAGDEETAEAARRNRADEEKMALALHANWDKFA
jgi:ferritin-like metal-binding protein YciE